MRSVGLSSIARSDWLHGIDLLDITELAHRRHQRRTAHVCDGRALWSRELPSKMLIFILALVFPPGSEA